MSLQKREKLFDPNHRQTVSEEPQLSRVSFTLSTAAVAFLNSLADSPRLRASLGSFAAPKRSMTMARVMMSSVGPRFKALPPHRRGQVCRPEIPGGTPAYGLAF